MKKIVSLLIGTLSFLTAVFPNRVYAQGAGESCCASGYTYGGGSCVNSTVCSVAANTSCVFARANVGGWSTPFDVCVASLERGCTSAVSWSNDPLETADSFCNYMLITLNLNPVYMVGCSVAIKPAVAAVGLITKTPSCDAGLECSSAGMCAEPGTAPGTTIPVYDPGCTPGDTDNVKTALGCLPTNPLVFATAGLAWATYLGAGIAFLLGIFGSTMIVLSAGNPEKMQAGKEMITSAIGGLLLIVFAVVILRLIGVNILGLFSSQTY